MATQITLPPTRSDGDPNPPADMNLVSGALDAMGAVAWITPTGDVTGASDTANLTAALGALPATGGMVYLAPGVFYGSSTVTITSPAFYIQGSGVWATTWNYVGSGPAFRMYSSASYSPGNAAGGGLAGFTIDGNGASAGACGFHIGDIYYLAFDVGVRRFQGSGSKGAWLDNNYYWTEQMHGRIWVEECTSGVVFDNSTNTSGSATGSFDRAVLDIFWDGKGKGNGVVFQNGAFIVDGKLGIYGNTDYGTTTYYVLTLTGSNGGGYSLISRSVLNIGVECNAVSGTQPATINFASATNNVIERCSGQIDFSGASAFAVANNWSGSFQFDGPVYGDNDLMRSTGIGAAFYKAGALSIGGLITTRFATYASVNPGSAVTGMILQGPGALSTPGPAVTVLNLSPSFSITFAGSGTSHVAAGTACSIQANSSCGFVWNSDTALWYPLQ